MQKLNAVIINNKHVPSTSVHMHGGSRSPTTPGECCVLGLNGRKLESSLVRLPLPAANLFVRICMWTYRRATNHLKPTAPSSTYIQLSFTTLLKSWCIHFFCLLSRITHSRPRWDFPNVLWQPSCMFIQWKTITCGLNFHHHHHLVCYFYHTASRVNSLQYIKIYLFFFFFFFCYSPFHTFTILNI